MPWKPGQRARNMRHAGRFYLDRRMCPNCGAVVYRTNENAYQRCKSCLKAFLYTHEPDVIPPRPPLSDGSPLLSTIEESDEVKDDVPSSRCSSRNSLRSTDVEPPLSDRSVSCSFTNVMVTAIVNLKPDSRGDSVVGWLDDQASNHNTESPQAGKGKWPTSHPTEPDPQNTSATSQMTAVPRLMVHDSPLPPPSPKQYKCTLRRPTRRIPRDPKGPSPSVITAHAVRTPDIKMWLHFIMLRKRLIAAAAAPPRRWESLRHPSPVIEPWEPGGVLQQHCADLHNALLPLEQVDEPEVRNSDEDALVLLEQPGTSGEDALVSLEQLQTSDEDALVSLEQPEVSNSDEVVGHSEEKKKKSSFWSRTVKHSCFKAACALGGKLKGKTDRWRR